MLTAMGWFITTAVTIGAIVLAAVAVLAALVWRQGWREGSIVEMRGGETIFEAPQQQENDRRQRRAANDL